VGLAGEIRAVGQMDQRLREAGRLGFTTFLMPESGARRLDGTFGHGMRVVPVRTVREVMERVFQPNPALRK